MPDIRIPQTHTWITWPSSKAGKIRITAALTVHSPVPIPAESQPSPPKTLRRLRSALKSRSNPPRTQPLRRWAVPIELNLSRRDLDRSMKIIASGTQILPILSEIDRRAEENNNVAEKRQIITHEHAAHIRSFFHLALRFCSPQEFLDDWSVSIAETLHYFGRHCAGAKSQEAMAERWAFLPAKDSVYRKDPQGITSVFERLRFRLVVRRAGLRALGELAGTPEGKRELIFSVRWQLLPPILSKLAGAGLPRGRHGIQAHFVKRTATTAIMMARELMVQVANGDSTLLQKLRQVCDEGSYGTPVHSSIQQDSSRHKMALCLAERTLRPVWKQYGLLSPIDHEPNEAYKHFCPPRYRADLRSMMKGLSPHNRQTFQDKWFRRLLGPIGQTAKEFDLALTDHFSC